MTTGESRSWNQQAAKRERSGSSVISKTPSIYTHTSTPPSALMVCAHPKAALHMCSATSTATKRASPVPYKKLYMQMKEECEVVKQENGQLKRKIVDLENSPSASVSRDDTQPPSPTSPPAENPRKQSRAATPGAVHTTIHNRPSTSSSSGSSSAADNSSMTFGDDNQVGNAGHQSQGTFGALPLHSASLPRDPTSNTAQQVRAGLEEISRRDLESAPMSKLESVAQAVSEARVAASSLKWKE